MKTSKTVHDTGWIQTFMGFAFHPLNPDPDKIEAEDIAHALSMQCRFTGHTRKFYSVAEHSVRVSHACPPEDALWGLMHDAAEAYLIDLARPVKCQPGMRAYRDAEARIMRAVCQRFELPTEQPKSVTRADNVLLATEKRDLLGPEPKPWGLTEKPLRGRIEPRAPQRAEGEFLCLFWGLMRRRADAREVEA